MLPRSFRLTPTSEILYQPYRVPPYRLGSTRLTESSGRSRSRILASIPCNAAWSATGPARTASPFGSFVMVSPPNHADHSDLRWPLVQWTSFPNRYDVVRLWPVRIYRAQQEGMVTTVMSVLLVILGYLLGSVPFAYAAGKWLKR